MKNIPAVMLGTMPAVWEMLGSLAVSLAIVCAFMPIFIPYLRKLKFGQQIIEEYGPTWHKNKQGVPTMGGIVFIVAAIAAFLLFGKNTFSSRRITRLIIYAMQAPIISAFDLME